MSDKLLRTVSEYVDARIESFGPVEEFMETDLRGLEKLPARVRELFEDPYRNAFEIEHALNVLIVAAYTMKVAARRRMGMRAFMDDDIPEKVQAEAERCLTHVLVYQGLEAERAAESASTTNN